MKNKIFGAVDSALKSNGSISLESDGVRDFAMHIAEEISPTDDQASLEAAAENNSMIAKASLMANNPQGFFKEAVSTTGLSANEQSFGVEVETEVPALESFSGDNPSMVQVATYAYNMSASRQSPAFEAMYPTIHGDPIKQGIQIIIDVPFVSETYLRDASGSNALKANKRSLVSVINDADSIIGTQKLKMIPVFNDTTKDQLVADFKVDDVKYDYYGDTVTTAPYVTGTTVNTLDVCQSDAMISKGIMTDEDGISRRISVESIAFTIGADKILLETPFAPQWGYTVNGSSRDVQMTDSSNVDINLVELTQFDGSANTEFAGLTAGYSARFTLRTSGHGNLITSDFVVDVPEFKFQGVVDATGALLTSGAVYDEYLAKVEDGGASKFEAVGYYLDITVHNKNLRNGGVHITGDPQGKYVPFKAITPIHITKPPVGQDIGDTDDRFLKGLVIYARGFANMNAARTTLDFINHMKSIPAGGDTSINAATDAVIVPTLTGGDLNLATEINSVRSGDRAVDIKAVFEGKLGLAITSALEKSRYFTFVEHTLDTHGTGKIDIAVVADLEIASLIGSTLDFGPEFNVKVFGTANSLYKGLITAVPTVFNVADRSKPEPKAFGNHIYAPVPVTDVVRTVSNSTANVYEVNPISIHEITSPVMACYRTTGITDALGNISVNMNCKTV